MSLPRRRWPARLAASDAMPSWRSPSEAMPYVRWSTIVVAGPVELARRGAAPRSPCRRAFAKPWPSGPVVASTPGVRPCSGWPGRARAPLAELPSGRRARGRSRSGAAASTGACSAWPAESTKRSRSGQSGWRGAWRRKRVQSDVGHRRRAHRRARVAGVRLLDAVDRQGADRVDRELVESFRCQRHRRPSVARRPCCGLEGRGPPSSSATGSDCSRGRPCSPPAAGPARGACISFAAMPALPLRRRPRGARAPRSVPVRRASPSSATSCSTWCWPPERRSRAGRTCPGGSDPPGRLGGEPPRLARAPRGAIDAGRVDRARSARPSAGGGRQARRGPRARGAARRSTEPAGSACSWRRAASARSWRTGAPPTCWRPTTSTDVARLGRPAPPAAYSLLDRAAGRRRLAGQSSWRGAPARS